MPNFWQRLKILFRPARPQLRAPRGPQGRIDAARNTEDGRHRWASADALGPNAAFDESIRGNLRNRSRSETLNNGYCKSLVRAKARDLVGTGPRLQLTIPRVSPEATKQVERRFAEWAKAVRLPRKLRVMEQGSVRDGDVFGVFDTDPGLDCPVKLEVTLIEAEQCTTPFEFAADRDVTDGVRHRQGKPVTFYFLREHPGERYGMTGPLAAWFAAPASQVLCWYRQDRANQLRGIPETTPALPIFNQIRRYRAAVLDAAEFAASHSGILYTDLPPEQQGTDVERFEIVDIVRNALKCMPHGWKLEQIKSEQPIEKYGEFNRENLNECGRSAEAPLNVVTGNSSGYNFSSGRLDHLPYQRGEWVDRDDFETAIVDRVFYAFAEEALQIPDEGYLPPGLPPLSEWKVEWNWDAFDEIDPLKSAQADGQRLNDGTATMAEVDAGRGVNWRDKADQLAIEVQYYRSKGLLHPFDPLARQTAPAVPPPDPNESQDKQDAADDQETARGLHRRNGHAPHLIGGVN